MESRARRVGARRVVTERAGGGEGEEQLSCFQIKQPLRNVWRKELEQLVANRDFAGAHAVQQKIEIREKLEANYQEYTNF